MVLLIFFFLYRYSNKTYRIDDIDWDLTPQRTFDLKDGSKVSYVDYYKDVSYIKLSGH